MSILATGFAVGIWRQRFSWQSDLLADLSKIGILIAVSTAAISFAMWTLTHRRAPRDKDSIVRGALAGVVTALVIIPLPAAVWAFKTEFLSLYQSGAIGAAFEALPLAIKAGLMTFVDITKASLVAVLGSLFVGAACAYFIPQRGPSRA